MCSHGLRDARSQKKFGIYTLARERRGRARGEVLTAWDTRAAACQILSVMKGTLSARGGSTLNGANAEFQLIKITNLQVLHSFNGTLTPLSWQEPCSEPKNSIQSRPGRFEFSKHKQPRVRNCDFEELFKRVGLSHRAFRTNFLYWRENICIILETHTT